MVTDICWLIIVLALCWAAWAYFGRWHHHPEPDRATVSASVQRLLKPRTPDDCPDCRRPEVLPRSAPAPPPRPWSEFKSRRGAPRRIVTGGFACPNVACASFRITDAEVHCAGYLCHPFQ